MSTDEAPAICIMRLSAIGDCCHVVPLVRALQRRWPAARLTWIIGRLEARLLRLLPGVEFIEVDKRRGWHSHRHLRRTLAGRRFAALLMLQPALRASLYSLHVAADRRIGWDRSRARELQWLFSNETIAAGHRQHALEIDLEFARTLGAEPLPLVWDLPLPEEAQAWARGLIPDDARTLVISPAASHAWRNWRAERYAAVARHAVRALGMQVLLCGSPAAAERELADRIIAQADVPLVDLVGRDTLPRLLALLARASVLLAPDSGPAHMATMVGTPVIGLYAATRSARTGPYLSRRWCVDRYAAAAQRFRGCAPEALHWHHDLRDAGVMDLIEVSDVIERLESLLAGDHAGNTDSHIGR